MIKNLKNEKREGEKEKGKNEKNEKNKAFTRGGGAVVGGFLPMKTV